MTKRLFGIVLMMMLMTTLSLKVSAGPVTVKDGIEHGTVTVDKATANPGETVTITVTPADGYYIEKANIKAEKTIDGGSAQAPSLNSTGPGVGSYVTINGEAPADVSQQATYTFVMPDEPYGVLVSAEFQACTELIDAMFQEIPEQEYTGSQITPTVACASGYNLTPGTDYTVGYGENIGLGQNTGIVSITGKGKYHGNLTMYFTIYRETYEIRWGIGTPWAEEHVIPMTKDATTGKWVAADQAMEATSEFKVVKKHEDGIENPTTWYGAETSDKYWITADNLGTEITLGSTGGYNNLYFPNAGVYTFTFDPSNNKLVVDGNFSITVTNPETQVTVDKTTAKAKELVTITITSPEGYEVDAVTVTDAANNNVAVTNAGEGAYTFTMPASNVTVAVTFVGYEVRWGFGNPWAEEHVIPMTNDATTGKWVVADQAMEATSSFKVVKKVMNGEGNLTTAWYGAQANDGMYWINKQTLNTEIQLYVDNSNLYFPNAGNYTFTFDPTTNKLKVTGDIYYNVTVANSEHGSVQADKTQAVEGETVTLTITPETGYELDELYYMKGNDQVDITGTSFQMPAADVEIHATFKVVDYTITVAEPQNGTVTAPATANYGDEVTVTVEPATGYELETLTYTAEGGEPITIENGKFSMPAANVTINATFKAIDYTITVANIQNGTVEAPATAHYGDEVNLTVTPANGYELETLTYTAEGGEPVAIENNKFTMPNANVTINATFKEIVVEYYFDVVEEVKCTLLNETNYPYLAPAGATITMRVVPDSGTKLKEVKVYKVTGYGQDKVETPIDYTIDVSETGDIYLSFVMPEMDVEVHAICADAFAVYVNAGDHGSAQADLIEAYEGETVTVTTSPNAKYWVDEIYYTYTVDGVEQTGELTAGENGTYTFSMPAAVANVYVTFNAYKLKYDTALEGGTVSVKVNGENYESMDPVAVISIVDATVTPAEGYEIDSFKVYKGIHNANDDFLGVEEISYDIMEGAYHFEMAYTDATILVTFKQIEVELEGVAFTAARQWATYYNGTKNLALPEGIKAYVVNSVVNDAVDITEINYIPAGVGVLLYSENIADQVTTTIYTGETGTYNSILVGSDEAQEITSGYVLYNNNFIRSEAGTVAAHRCYLPATQVSGAPHMLKIGLGDVPTAIESIIAQGNVAGIKYVNLNGMISNEPFRGINIAVITFTDGSTTTVKVVK